MLSFDIDYRKDWDSVLIPIFDQRRKPDETTILTGEYIRKDMARREIPE
jgi:hypothetical protein